MPSACLVPAAQVDGHSVATVEAWPTPMARRTRSSRRSSTNSRCSAVLSRLHRGVGQPPGRDPRSNRRRHPARALRQPAPLHWLLPDHAGGPPGQCRAGRTRRACSDERRSVPLRHDAAAKTDGSIEYAGDAVRPEHCTPLSSSRRAHARMLSMSTDAARAVPGVVDIITAADTPVNEYGLNGDQPALVGSTTRVQPPSTLRSAAGKRIRSPL